MRPHPPSRGLSMRADDGFTLLELMIVFVITALAASLVLPRIGAGSEQAALRSAALQLAAGLRATRTEAMSGSRDAAFVIDMPARRYWADGAVRPRGLPRGIAVLTGHAPGAPIITDRATVRFKPDGSASGGWIGLRSQTSAADITIDWLTGATHIDFAR
jgi:general secretion pathway protein H